jgi:putative FmdB family regulatory protein
MPIYEFYCPDCHTIFNFLSRTVDTVRQPACPRCRRPALERQVSAFAISKGRKEAEDGLPADLDDERLEGVMEGLAREAEGIDENDPRQLSRMMRRLYEATGLPLGGPMEEALRRLESGEDPDQIEAEMGDQLEELDPFSLEGVKRARRRLLPPAHDETLYEM